MRGVAVAFGVVLASLLLIAPPAGTQAGPQRVRAGAINVEPSMRPWRYGGANPDGWWCRPPECNGVRNGTVFVDRELKLIAQLHVSYLRLEFPRPLIEPRKGVFDWRRADYIVNRAHKYGVKLLPLLLYTPSWDGATLSSPPSVEGWRGFVSAVARRYRKTVAVYDLWDEPDSSLYWTGDAGDYVRTVLKPGYQAIKAANRRARVVLGGPKTADLDWLNAVYQAGGGKYFDIMSFHDYSADRRILDHARQVQALLRAHGQGKKPIWLGEYGVMEAGTGDVHQDALIRILLTEKAPLALAGWYALRDDHVMTCCPPSTLKIEPYGLTTTRYVRKRAFATMRTLLGAPAQR